MLNRRRWPDEAHLGWPPASHAFIISYSTLRIRQWSASSGESRLVTWLCTIEVSFLLSVLCSFISVSTLTWYSSKWLNLTDIYTLAFHFCHRKGSVISFSNGQSSLRFKIVGVLWTSTQLIGSILYGRYCHFSGELNHWQHTTPTTIRSSMLINHSCCHFCIITNFNGKFPLGRTPATSADNFRCRFIVIYPHVLFQNFIWSKDSPFCNIENQRITQRRRTTKRLFATDVELAEPSNHNYS